MFTLRLWGQHSAAGFAICRLLVGFSLPSGYFSGMGSLKIASVGSDHHSQNGDLAEPMDNQGHSTVSKDPPLPSPEE